MVVQSLGLCASTAGATGSVPDGGTKIPHVVTMPKKINYIIKLKKIPSYE